MAKHPNEGMKRFRTCGLDQPFLLPPSLQDWLPDKHLARFIAEVVDTLDLGAIYSVYGRKDNRGVVAYHPLMLTRVLLYGYAIGLTSSRRIEKATYDDLAFRFLAADQHPDHDTIADFRQQHLDALATLFVQALQLCRKAGLVKLGNVAIDGSKIKANASWHRGTTYSKLSEEEFRLRAIIDNLLAEASATDSEEDARFGKGNAGDELPAELSSAQQRLERIRQAKQELEAEAKQRLEQASRAYPARKRGPIPKQKATQEPLTADQKQVREKLKSRLMKARRAAKQPTRQYNLTDPDSRMMMDTAQRHLVFAYNGQAAVDSHAQVILGADLTQEPTDSSMLLPMIEQVRQSMGQCPATITADAGYWDTDDLRPRN